MKSRWKNCVSADIPEVWNWVPDDPRDVYYYLEMTIGKDTKSGDLFGLTVSTPEALSKRMRTSGPQSLSGRHHLIVLDYSWDKFVNLSMMSLINPKERIGKM